MSSLQLFVSQAKTHHTRPSPATLSEIMQQLSLINDISLALVVHLASRIVLLGEVIWYM